MLLTSLVISTLLTRRGGGLARALAILLPALALTATHLGETDVAPAGGCRCDSASSR